MFSRLKEFFLLEIAIPLGDKLMKTQTHKYYHLIRRMGSWSREEVCEWQLSHLQRLIKHHYENTPYYTKLFKRLGLLPGDIATLEDLKKIPPLNKSIIYDNYEDFIPRNIDSITHKKGATGGSVSPLKYLLSLNAWSFTTATKIFSWKSCGYRYGEPFATLGGSSLFSTDKRSWRHDLYHKLRSSLRLTAANMSEETIEDYIRRIRKSKVRYIYGYAAAVYLLAKFVNENQIQLSRVKGCFTTSEVLTEDYRKEVEKAFGYVMDCYGARDGGVTAFEINSAYYNVGYNSIIETTNEFEKDTGTILATDLLNYAFPFIRYEIGDEVILPKDLTPYDYNGQVIKQIFGRTPDIMRLENGRTLIGVGFYMMFKIFNVKAYKVVKTGRLKLLIQIQPNDLYEKEIEEREIVNTIKKHAGNDCEVEIEYTHFQEENNSKRRFIMVD